jgi:hypothetical protein
LPSPHVPSFPSDWQGQGEATTISYETLAWTTALSTDKSVPKKARLALSHAPHRHSSL